MLEKKKRAKITYQNRECFIQSFEFDKEVYISVNALGTEFTSIDSDKVMNLYDLRDNESKIKVRSIANIDNPCKKRYIGKEVEGKGVIAALFLKFEDNKLLMSMNLRK